MFIAKETAELREPIGKEKVFACYSSEEELITERVMNSKNIKKVESWINHLNRLVIKRGYKKVNKCMKEMFIYKCKSKLEGLCLPHSA